MRIISWNVNGLRALCNRGDWDWLIKELPDIFCLQETKCVPDQLPAAVVNVPGYHSYFSSPTNGKKGYSGVAIYTKQEPLKVEYGLGIPEFDNEGRVLVAKYEKFTLLNIYFPNGGRGPERIKYKLDFYEAFLDYVEKLRQNGERVIFCGDVNTAHKEIDLARPEENKTNTGFLPEERAWIDKVVSLGYVDTFRHFYPDKKDVYTYWDMKTFARERNVGWRIDYFFVSSELEKNLVSFTNYDKVYGSDHCPIELEIRV